MADHRDEDSALVGPKRKSNEPQRPTPAKKPRRAPLDHKYRHLLNEEIQILTRGDSNHEDGDPFKSSRIGLTYWTSLEKHEFFKALTKLGRSDLQQIASSIKTKSCVEVGFYIQSLRRRAEEQHLLHRKQRLLGVIDMPAAIEIGPECCTMLEEYADSLIKSQQRQEASFGHQKWGDLWLLTAETGDFIQSKLEEDEEGDGLKEVAKILPAAELLKLETWLELSEMIFMNSAIPRGAENWREVADNDENPSIHYTAFQDFANLAVSVTERLVQTTLFCATSRCRAMDSERFTREFAFEAEDVLAACELLGMPSDSRYFWVYAARKSGVHVHRTVAEAESASAAAAPIDYDELEDFMKGPSTKRRMPCAVKREIGHEGVYHDVDDETSSQYSSSSETMMSSSDQGEDSNAQHTESSQSSSAEPIPGSDSSNDSEFPSQHNAEPQKGRRRLVRDVERMEEQYMEALDKHASSTEEKRLRELLGRPDLNLSSTTTTTTQISERPIRERKGAPDLVDWRDRIKFWSEWETLGGYIAEKAFEGRRAVETEFQSGRRTRTKVVGPATLHTFWDTVGDARDKGTKGKVEKNLALASLDEQEVGVKDRDNTISSSSGQANSTMISLDGDSSGSEQGSDNSSEFSY